MRDRFTRTAEIFGSAMLKTRAAEAEILAHMVSAKTSDGAVDLACGTGALAMAFAPRVRWICGLDLTPAMIAVAERAAHDAQVRNVTFAIGNAQQIPFPDGSLDLALSSYALHHVPDSARVIGEMARVLKRGGRVGMIDIFVLEDSRARRNARPNRARPRSFAYAHAAAERIRVAFRRERPADQRTRGSKSIPLHSINGCTRPGANRAIPSTSKRGA